ATCGILYLASYLRPAGIEAYVRLYDGEETEEAVRESLAALIQRVRPPTRTRRQLRPHDSFQG
ncbi:MAG: hypothetical protein ACT4TC_25725, partial [Myxococcaceae bacterium]